MQDTPSVLGRKVKHMAKSKANEELEILQGKDWELDSIDIRCATNGYTVRVSFDKREPGDDDGYDASHKSQEHVFTSEDAVAEFVKEVLVQDDEDEE